MSSAAAINASLVRKLAVASVFALAYNIAAWQFLSGDGNDPSISMWLPYRDKGLESGVGLVTTDGMWDEIVPDKYKDQEIKILGFTDRNYIPIARVWYTRMTMLVGADNMFPIFVFTPCALSISRLLIMHCLHPIFTFFYSGLYRTLCGCS